MTFSKLCDERIVAMNSGLVVSLANSTLSRQSGTINKGGLSRLVREVRGERVLITFSKHFVAWSGCLFVIQA